jgi:RNA polymerase-binding transcription factor DksA
MVKKAVAPAKKAGHATSKPASKAAAPVKAAAKSAPAKNSTKTGTAKAAPTKATVKTASAEPVSATAKQAPTAKHAAAKSAPSKSAPSQPASSKPASAQQASAKQPPKESVKQPIADAPAKASPKPIDTAATPPAETRRAPAAKKAPAPPAPTMPSVKGETKEGIKYTKDFDAKFLLAQRKLLIEARESLTGQAVRLEDEANSLIDDEMGDVQFDDESGEGDTMVVERERDLFLSARARQDIEEIDSALHRLELGTYGYSVVSMRPIPRERLEAIPWATELTEEKVGGIGRR